MAPGWKGRVERSVAGSSLVRRLVRTRSRRPAILAYHNIVPVGEGVVGDVSLHLDQRDFADQLDRIAETHDVVGLEELLDDDGAPATRPKAAITFDDAYRGALTAGLHELEKRGFPATVFVAPGLLGHEAFWWDALAAGGPEGLSPGIRAEALHRLAGRHDSIIEWSTIRGLGRIAVPEHARPSEAQALFDASATTGLRLGAHSWGHPNLTRLGNDELVQELTRTASWLEERTETYIPWLAFPYGLAGEREVLAARDCGYRGALRVSGGLVRARGSVGAAASLRLPRINVPRGLSIDGLSLRLMGILS